MSTFTVIHPVSKKSVTIENPLLSIHIKEGCYIWIEGTSPTSSYPAVITKVDTRRKTFRVRSFVDFKVQEQEYSFTVDGCSSFSRQAMRLIGESVIREYLEHRRTRLNHTVSSARKAHDSARVEAETFAGEVAKLDLTP